MTYPSIKRREFIKLGALTSIGAMIAPQTVFSQKKRPACIIIGAGLAGLAAGLKLKNAGWNIILIDGRSRIGGRVFSHKMGADPKLVCELGAEWVGASHERIMAHCKDFGLELQDHRFEDFLMRNGNVSRPKEWGFSKEAETGLKKILGGMESSTLAQQMLLDRQDWWSILKKNGFSDDDLRIRDLIDSTDFGESIRFVSGYAAAAEYAESSPNNEMDFKITGGNSRLTEEFAKRVGEGSFKLNTIAEEIRQVKGIVTVKTNNGIFTADACICTAPTASLQKIKFIPALPAVQKKAAESLIYARIIKNSVLYDERFWKEDNFSMVSDSTSHYYFHSTQKQAGREGILTAYAIGDKADVMAAQDDKRKMEIITRDLAPFNENAPKLAKNIASYAWQRDEFTKGAYALYRPGQWFGIRPVLAKPHGKVLFAGEHVADWQGFMEGAIETGEDAAKLLIK